MPTATLKDWEQALIPRQATRDPNEGLEQAKLAYSLAEKSGDQQGMQRAREEGAYWRSAGSTLDPSNQMDWSQFRTSHLVTDIGNQRQSTGGSTGQRSYVPATYAQPTYSFPGYPIPSPGTNQGLNPGLAAILQRLSASVQGLQAPIDVMNDPLYQSELAGLEQAAQRQGVRASELLARRNAIRSQSMKDAASEIAQWVTSQERYKVAPSVWQRRYQERTTGLGALKDELAALMSAEQFSENQAGRRFSETMQLAQFGENQKARQASAQAAGAQSAEEARRWQAEQDWAREKFGATMEFDREKWDEQLKISKAAAARAAKGGTPNRETQLYYSALDKWAKGQPLSEAESGILQAKLDLSPALSQNTVFTAVVTGLLSNQKLDFDTLTPEKLRPIIELAAEYASKLGRLPPQLGPVSNEQMLAEYTGNSSAGFIPNTGLPDRFLNR